MRFIDPAQIPAAGGLRKSVSRGEGCFFVRKHRPLGKQNPVFHDRLEESIAGIK
jgi:hypothetical protein